MVYILINIPEMGKEINGLVTTTVVGVVGFIVGLWIDCMLVLVVVGCIVGCVIGGVVDGSCVLVALSTDSHGLVSAGVTIIV